MIFRLLIVSAILLSSTSCNGLHADEKTAKITLRLCSLETNFGNYTTATGDGTWQELVKESVKDLSINLVFFYAPIERCLLKTRKNDMDAIYASLSVDRSSYLRYPLNKLKTGDISKAVGTVQYKIYKKQSSDVDWDGKMFTNLGGNSIGVQRGLQIEQSLRDNKIKVDGDLVLTPEQNMTKLHLGRIVAAAVEEQAGDDFLKSSGYTDIVKLEKSYLQSNVYLAFSNKFYNKNQALVEKIWDNIKSNRKKMRTTPANIKIGTHSFMVQI